MSNTIIHTKCLGHCRAQSLTWKATPALHAQQKASTTAYEASQAHSPTSSLSPITPAEFHGHCWATKTPPNSPQSPNTNAAGTTTEMFNGKACLGHVRAQEIAVRGDAARIAYEMEKASIKGYEEGWDRWDGPVWPYRGAVEMGVEEEERYDNGYAPPELDGRVEGKAEL
ncbi:hypothetical protein Vi05172_g11545 [Venturia inaequalis]|nr:hypothetical protein Vi05172_g11545 [Venturia inaequalis]